MRPAGPIAAMDTTAHDLVDRFKAGDPEAFALIFERYRSRLVVLLRYRMSAQLKTTMEVDDVLQEVFLRAFQDLARFEYRGAGSVMRWLSALAEHILVDLARFQGREKRSPGELVRLRSATNPGGPEPAVSLTPSRILLQSEGVRRLFARMDKLPEQYREAILLTKIAGLSTAEMGRRLGKAPDAASLLLHRAVKRLRELDESMEPTR
jgi:RNA polymerase sigma-70 factor (ECF subfamily)